MQRTCATFRSGFAGSANPRLPVRQRQPRLLQIHVIANNSAGAGKGKGDDVVKTLKVVPAILKDEKGVGVLAIMALATAAKLVEIPLRQAAEVVKRELQPALDNAPENLEAWKKSLAGAMEEAQSSARHYVEEIGTNLEEAKESFIESTETINQQLAKEAEIGEENWKKTTAAITAPAPILEHNETDVVAVLAEVEDKGAELLKTVGKGIKDLSEGKYSLATGWGAQLLPHEETEASNKVETPASLPSLVEAAAKAEADPIAKKTEETSSVSVDQTPAASPPVSAALKSKTSFDSTLDEVTKGGRHVSMLSAPMSADSTYPFAGGKSSQAVVPTASTPTRVTPALGFSRTSGSNSPVTTSSGNPSTSSGGGARPAGQSGTGTLRSSAASGVFAASVAQSGGGSGGEGGGSGGGDGNGGQGNNNDNSSSGGSSNNVFFLLLLLAFMLGCGAVLVKKSREESEKSSFELAS